MDFLKKNKAILGGLAAIAVAVYVYLNYFSGGSAPLTATPVDDSSIAGDLLVTLNSLHTLRLDDSLFKDPVFGSLSDFGVTIPPQDAGRRNPFAPLGRSTPPPAQAPEEL
jgi:hypothetical protein